MAYPVKNQKAEITITDLDTSGAGIGRSDGMPVFVAGALPGDRVLVNITKVKKNMAYGHLLEIISPSADRVEPRCAVAKVCGGCQIQALDYRAQLKFKEERVRSCLMRIGGFDEGLVNGVMRPIHGMEDPWHYRNKAQVPFGKDKDGKTVCGYYATRSHRIIPCTDCAIGPAEQDGILQVLLKHMETFGIEPYDENDGSGLIRHAVIRKGYATGELMVCLVINHAPVLNPDQAKSLIPGASELIQQLFSTCSVNSICLNFNDKNTNVITGDESVAIFGEDYITDELMGIRFRISPTSFYQVNPIQTAALYGYAVDAAGLKGHEKVYDLYCGVGTISLAMAARGAGHVTGIEVVPSAVSDAKQNAMLNGIDNVTFIRGKAEDLCDGDADVIVVDPPRKGCDAELLKTILAAGPSKVVYVSCDPATLSRDLKILAGGGYNLKSVQPVDCFCHTVHVECVSLLQRMSNTRERTITLDVEMEDYHRIKNRTEVTADVTE